MTSGDGRPDGRFEALARSAPDAILTIDAESIVLSANPAVERIFGYEPEELIGRSLHMLIPERMRHSHDTGVEHYLATGKRNVPWTGLLLPAVRKDGSEIPVEISFGEFIEPNGRRVFSGFVRDVSERVRYERDLEAARAAAVAARHQAEAALRELRAIGRITDVAIGRSTYDEMLHELLARLSEELSVDEASVLLVDDASRSLVMSATHGPSELADPTKRIPIGSGIAGRVAATGEPVVIEDLSRTEVVGTRLAAQMSSTAVVPVRNENRVVGVLRVSSRERRAFGPEDIRLLEIVADRMAGALARTRLFEAERRAREEAEQARHARDEVLSIVSHDLRNPVSTVAMSAALLRDPELTLSDEERLVQLDVIARSAERMNRLIRDLLDVARIERGSLTIDCRCHDAGALAAEACDSFQGVAQEKSLVLGYEVADGLPKVYVDRDRILQALSNFLNNSVKFTPAGGRVVVTVRGAPDRGVRFDVTDTGPGIAPDELPHVFTRFWQARRTAHLGTGLGLSIVKGIAVAHRGTVDVQSEVGHGSTFSLVLPFSAECA
jgi:PAS domain S-box-containing protein